MNEGKEWLSVAVVTIFFTSTVGARGREMLFSRYCQETVGSYGNRLERFEG